MRFTALIAALLIACGSSDDPEPDPDPDITVATLNILHGLFCPNTTLSCRLEERIDLLLQWVEGTGCPDVVALQEVSSGMDEMLEARLDAVCDGAYELVYERYNSLDDAIVLSRHPVSSSSAESLHDGFRHAMVVTIDHPAGQVTVATTHLASGSDGANDPCGASCPTECTAAGVTTNRQCQAVQLADIVEGLGGALVTGDFNAEPGSFEYDHLVGRGWVDTYLAAGNAECVSATGEGCTSGREDEDLTDMEDPGLNQDERIDYIFDASSGTGCALEAAGDTDGDGVETGGFAHQPNPYAADCGPAPLSLCWPSDHGGVAIDLNCD